MQTGTVSEISLTLNMLHGFIHLEGQCLLAINPLEFQDLSAGQDLKSSLKFESAVIAKPIGIYASIVSKTTLGSLIGLPCK